MKNSTRRKINEIISIIMCILFFLAIFGIGIFSSIDMITSNNNEVISDIYCEELSDIYYEELSDISYSCYSNNDENPSVSNLSITYTVTEENLNDTIEDSANDLPEVAVSEVIIEKPHNVYIDMTEDEIYTLATLVYLEAGSESYECQVAVASVVINRMTLDNRSLNSVIYEEGQFTPAYKISYTHPTSMSIQAVRDVVENGPNIPEYVTYFRAGYYHNWDSRIVDYDRIDDVYFSYDKYVREGLV